MFSDVRGIDELTRLLSAREASLWHACQLAELRSYLRLNGIPSRQRLERQHLTFTPFQSDVSDRSRGVWDAVFLTLNDLGRPFGQGFRSVPCVYGPIALQLAPQALREASEVAVCLRSAGSAGFDRVGEALKTLEEVDELFAYPVGAGGSLSWIVRFGDALRNAFPNVDARCPELSCRVTRMASPGSSVLSFEHLVVIWVDPIVVRGNPLIETVRELVKVAGLEVRVRERSMQSERRIVLEELVAIAADGYIPLRLIPSRSGVSDATRDWARAAQGSGLEFVWERFVDYLRNGTLGYEHGPGAGAPVRKRPKPSRGPVGSARPLHIAEVIDRLKEQGRPA